MPKLKYADLQKMKKPYLYLPKIRVHYSYEKTYIAGSQFLVTACGVWADPKRGLTNIYEKVTCPSCKKRLKAAKFIT